MATPQDISAEFPFESKYVEVLGSKMHFVEEGSGDPILLLHGNPTSSYLWRNIIPYAAQVGRAIAPDLIGMGKSDKPNIGYRFVDHVPYVEGFIEKMALQNITLVIHDWGSGLGFHYAARHADNVKAIAFMEAMVRPLTWADMPADFRTGFRFLRTPGIGWVMVVAMNMFVKQMLPQGIVRELTDEEKARYGEPYKTLGSRKPVRQWPNEIPIDGKPADVHEAVSNYSNWLQETDLPKLLFHADPGGLITAELLEWIKQNFKNLTTVDIGPGVHFLQEDNPHLIGSQLLEWRKAL